MKTRQSDDETSDYVSKAFRTKTKKAAKVAIFMPGASPFYRYVLRAMCRGFEEAGNEVRGGCGLLPEEALVSFCREYKPDIVIEMNRSRSDVPGLPKNVVHICWLVDLWEKGLSEYHGSEIILFFDPSWKAIYPHKAECLCDTLPPGSSLELESAKSGGRYPLHHFSFTGHIPKPWDEEELNRMVSVNDGPALRFGDLYEAVLRESHGGAAVLTPQKAVCRIKRLIRRGCKVPKKRKSDPVNRIVTSYLPRVLTYDVGTRMARLWGRRQLLDCAIAISGAVGIYGSENWAMWEQYHPYYRGNVENPVDLIEIYRGSCINLHQGVGMHFRALDCMASGGVVFAMSREWENLPGEIGEYFEDGKEFVSFTIDDFSEKAEEILGDHRRRQKMGQAAARTIAASHTWRHRAEKIMRDYRSL